MKVLVTGGHGFLGSHLINSLLREGFEVTAVCRRPNPTLTARGVHVIVADLADPEATLPVCRGQEIVFHTAAKAGYWGAFRDYHHANVVATQNILESCLTHGVRKLVHTSTPSVVFDGHDIDGGNESLPYASHPLTAYQKTKIAAEKLVLAAHGRNGLATVALRPHIIWGNGDRHILPRLLQRARQGKLIQVGDGRNQVSVIHVDDAARGHIQAALSSRAHGKAYFINHPKPVRFWHWIGRILTAANLPRPHRTLNYHLAYALGAICEMAFTALPGEPPMTRFLAAQLAKSHHFDISAAVRDFGFSPTVDPDTGITTLDFTQWLSPHSASTF